MDLETVKTLAERPGIRSADRANLRTMAKKLARGKALDYQERQNLWAYFNRYGVPAVDVRPDPAHR